MQDLAFNIDASLKNIFSWFDNNRLLINNEKSLAIGFHHINNKNIIFQDIMIKGRQITYASGTKFLGIWLDKNLTWNLHIDNLVCKLSKLCYVLRISRNLIDENVARIMHYAYFNLFLKYGILFLGISKNYKKVFISQNRAVRILANVSITRCKPLFQAL
jgi:hypothetical protein